MRGTQIDSPMAAALAKGKMSTFNVVMAVASAVALTVVIGLVVPSGIAVGMVGIPITVVAVAVLLAVFTPGYTAMARCIPNTGAFYAYIAQGIGRPFGVGAAWVALVAYNFIQVGGYGAFGAIGAGLLQHFFGVDVQWFVVAMVAWIIIAVLGLLDFSVPVKVMLVLALVETVIDSFYTVSILFTPGFHLNWHAVSLSNLIGPAIGGMVTLGALIFVGFEIAAAYVEEARTIRVVPRATYISILLIAAVVSFASLVVFSAGGPDVVHKAAGPDNLFFSEASVVLGRAALTGGDLLLEIGVLAAGLAFAFVIIRYSYALGRERVLPAWLGVTGANGAPRNASIAQTVIGVVVIWWAAIADWNPMAQLFFIGATGAGLGVLVLITATSFAVIAYFARPANRRKENLWRRLIAPAIAGLILLAISSQAISSLPTLFGLTSRTGPALIVPIVYLVVFVGGIVWALVLKAREASIYQGIGHGAESVVAGLAGRAALSGLSQPSGDEDGPAAPTGVEAYR